MQALSIAWDARPVAQGGQRWFSLTPGPRVLYTDDLHWTGRQYNWNYMCADCHSTDLKKNYNLAARFDCSPCFPDDPYAWAIDYPSLSSVDPLSHALVGGPTVWVYERK